MTKSAVPLAIVVAAILVLAGTGNLLSASPVAVALQVTAVALNVWARRAFEGGTFRVTAAAAGASLIRRGPYR